jgi:hypothetical protein
MAISCPVDLDTRRLRDEIRSIYARVAAEPSGEFHFHRGPDYAAEFLRRGSPVDAWKYCEGSDDVLLIGTE